MSGIKAGYRTRAGKRVQLRLGLAGLNFGTKVILPALEGIPGFRLAAVCARDPVKACAVAQKWKIPKVETNYKKLALDPELDALILALPPDIQVRLISHAAKAGKHLFCEKPLAHNLRAGRRALRVVRNAKVRHGIDFLFTEIPAWRALARLLRKGRIGRPLRAVYRWRIRRGRGPLPSGSWKMHATRGGGLAGNFLCHVFHNLEFLLGPVHGPAEARHQDDRCCRFSVRVGAGVQVDVHLEIRTAGLSRHAIRIFGTKGELGLCQRGQDYARGFFLRHRLMGRQNSFRRIPVLSSWQGGDGRIRPVRALLRRFQNAIRSGKEMRPNLEDAGRIQAYLEQFRR